ncbi:unnamed protein product [Rhizophagus irregularis]|nr:unnamed protein product [Rhizophagus irregularis]
MKVIVNDLNNENEHMKVIVNGLNNEKEKVEFLRNYRDCNINMVLGVIVLLIEMKRESNDAFHQGWQKVDEIKKQLDNQQFPDGMEKYKDSLQRLTNASNTWITWK